MSCVYNGRNKGEGCVNVKSICPGAVLGHFGGGGGGGGDFGFLL